MRLAAMAFGLLAVALPAKAGGLFSFRHTIPREVLAQDFRTGGIYMAPPIPYGHYAKDSYVDCIHSALAHVHGMIGKLCSHCYGKGCNACGGQGCLHGDPCGACGGQGCDTCGHKGLFAHHRDRCSTCAGLGGSGGGLGHGFGHSGAGLCGDPGCGTCGGQITASAQAPVVSPSPQAAVPACGGCGKKSCGFCGGNRGGLLHHARSGKHGLGHGGLGHGHGGAGAICEDPGCGLGHGGAGDVCGDPGCGLGHGHGHGLLGHHKGGGDPACQFCGGQGCGHCLGLFDHHLLKTGLNHFFGPKVEYFVGPGGPVPLTPGYVPYVNPVRSPRDFFAFPPFTDQAF